MTAYDAITILNLSDRLLQNAALRYKKALKTRNNGSHTNLRKLYKTSSINKKSRLIAGFSVLHMTSMSLNRRLQEHQEDATDS